jgi:lysozyme
VAAGITGAVPFIKPHEGERRAVYDDALGNPTVCFGHTGPDVQFGQAKRSAQDCSDYLNEDILTAWQTIERCAGPSTYKLTHNQRVAFVSFTLNVGPGGKGVKDGFCRLKSGNEPTILRKIKAGDYTGACLGLLDWTNPKHLRGLLIRRQKEAELCLKP